MNYKYDIFISYRRLGNARDWIEKYFNPLLINHLSQDLGRDPSIFLDSKIETGVSWPIKLGQAISSSKVMITFWTAKYLESHWCACEIGHMLEREKKFRYRTFNNSEGLIFPLVISDGDTMPVEISTIQAYLLKEYFKITLNEDGRKYTEFEDQIKILAGAISKSLVNVPSWQSDWEIEAVNSSVEKLHKVTPAIQSNPPKFI